VNSAVVSKEEREKMFTEFLARQKAAEMRKERKVNVVVVCRVCVEAQCL
jgi:hypothetical protein